MTRLSEGEMIQRTGRGHCGSCASDFLRELVKVLARFESTLGYLSERCGIRQKTGEGSKQICRLVALS
jgi:hypothetical protein